VDGRDDRLRLSERLAADRARVLERHRVALLGHDAAALHEPVGQPQVVELGGRPKQQVLDDASEPHEQHHRRRHALEQVVHRRDAAVRISRRRAEAQKVRREVPVDRKAGAGDGARAEGTFVRARVGGFQPRGIALELLDHGQQVMRHRRRLRSLCVRVHGEDGFAVADSEVEEGAAEVDGCPGQVEDAPAMPHPVHGHVDVVAAARRVEPAGDIVAALPGDQPVDVEEEILVRAVVADPPHVGLMYAVQRCTQRVRMVLRQDPLRGQHHDMRSVNRHERSEEELLGVLEVLVEDAPYVFRSEPHITGKYMREGRGDTGCRIRS
jgi:hypothetical protein